MGCRPSSELASCEAFWTAIDRTWQPKYRKVELDHRRRLDSVVPGSALQPRPDDDRIPLLLIARDGTWTVLTPAGTGMMFWPSLVSVIPRVGGQRERQQRQYEAGRPSFPRDWALTHAGDAMRESEARVEEDKWHRRNSGHRINYELLGTSSPWRPQWKTLVRGEPWLLTGAVLAKLTDGPGLDTLSTLIAQSRAKRGLPAVAALRLNDALVSVRLAADGRGLPTDNAAIFDEATLLPIGFVTTGRFSLATGSGRALALVTLDAWLSGTRSVVYKNEQGKDMYRAALLL